MQLLTLEAVGIPQKHVVEKPIQISSFGSDASSTLSYVNVDLGVVQFEQQLVFISSKLTPLAINSSRVLDT